MTKIINSLMVAIGGAIGSYLRYVLSFFFSIDFVSTLIVNLLGSFLLGVITAVSSKNERSWLKLLLGTGFCGGFTTMSTFSLELTHLPLYLSIIYVCITIVGGLGLVLVGMNATTLLRRDKV